MKDLFLIAPEEDALCAYVSNVFANLYCTVYESYPSGEMYLNINGAILIAF